MLAVCFMLVVYFQYLTNFHFTDDLDGDIEHEKNIMIELDAKIRDWERKIKHLHKNMGGIHMSSQHTVQTQKTIHTLENRLDQV